MSLCLQRGEGSVPALDAGQTLLRWSAHSPPSGPILSLFRKTHELWIHDARTQTQASMQRSGDLYAFPLTQDTWLWAGMLPPWQMPDLSRFQGHGVYLPFQGWLDQQWCDGPLLHFGASAFFDIVPAGAPCLLTLGQEKKALHDVQAFLDEQRGEALRRSFLLALRQWRVLPHKPAYGFQPAAWDLQTVFSLLIHRIAFPQQRFFMLSLPDAKPEAWKRLAQNLNIEIPRIAPPEILPLPCGIPLAPDSVVEDFLSELLHKAPFIPGQLWADLRKASAGSL